MPTGFGALTEATNLNFAKEQLELAIRNGASSNKIIELERIVRDLEESVARMLEQVRQTDAESDEAIVINLLPELKASLPPNRFTDRELEGFIGEAAREQRNLTPIVGRLPTALDTEILQHAKLKALRELDRRRLARPNPPPRGDNVYAPPGGNPPRRGDIVSSPFPGGGPLLRGDTVLTPGLPTRQQAPSSDARFPAGIRPPTGDGLDFPPSPGGGPHRDEDIFSSPFLLATFDAANDNGGTPIGALLGAAA